MAKKDKPLKSWDTKVRISKSQEDIRNILARFGAMKVTFEDDLQTGKQTIRFVYKAENWVKPANVVFNIELGGIVGWLVENGRRSWTTDYVTEQAKRVAWRHILDWLKVNLNLVEYGLAQFEGVFLSYFGVQLPDGSFKSFGEHVRPRLMSGDFHLLESGHED